MLEMELGKIKIKKYFKKNKVYFGNTDMEIKKLKKKNDYFYIYVDKNFERYYITMGGEVKGKYYCLCAKEIKWGNEDGFERIERKL